MGEERRRDARTELSSKLILKRLDDSSDEHREVDIEIVDVSKSGIGFICTEELGIGEVYEADLVIWTQERLHTVLQIVRAKKTEDAYVYGASYMAISETDIYRIEVYQTVLATKQKNKNWYEDE